MSRTASLRRPAAILGTTTVLCLAAAPAMAFQDPGTGGTQASAGRGAADTSQRREGGITYPQYYAPRHSAADPASPTVVVMESHPVDYRQVGVGLLAGLAIAGAGVAVASGRNRRGLTPA